MSSGLETVIDAIRSHRAEIPDGSMIRITHNGEWPKYLNGQFRVKHVSEFGWDYYWLYRPGGRVRVARFHRHNLDRYIRSQARGLSVTIEEGNEAIQG